MAKRKKKSNGWSNGNGGHYSNGYSNNGEVMTFENAQGDEVIVEGNNITDYSREHFLLQHQDDWNVPVYRDEHNVHLIAGASPAVRARVLRDLERSGYRRAYPKYR